MNRSEYGGTKNKAEGATQYTSPPRPSAATNAPTSNSSFRSPRLIRRDMLKDDSAEAPPVFRPPSISSRDDDDMAQLKRLSLGSGTTQSSRKMRSNSDAKTKSKSRGKAVAANAFGATPAAPPAQIRRRSWVSSYSSHNDQEFSAIRGSTNSIHANQNGDDSSRRRNSLLGSIYSMRNGNVSVNSASLNESPAEPGAFYVRTHAVRQNSARTTTSLYPGELEQLRPLSQDQSTSEDERYEFFANTRSSSAQGNERPTGRKETIFHADAPPDVIINDALEWNQNHRSSKNSAPLCFASALFLSLLIAGLIVLLESNFTTRPKLDAPETNSTISINYNCDQPSGPGNIIKTQRYNILKEVLELKVDASILEDPCSSHASALKWLADEDKLLKVSPLSHSDVHQRFAVALFYYSSNMGETDLSPDFNKVKEPWLTQEQECLWHGITCQYNGGGDGALITHIELESIELSGSIPDEFVIFLPNLTHLDLSQNALIGTIPKCLYSSSTLVDLNLGSNKLSGPIGVYEWTSWNMEKMTLHRNAFNGTIPTSLGSLSNIQMLDFFGNELDGSISEEIMNLPGLKEIYLKRNFLRGTLPTSISSSLETIDFSYNRIEGIIPTALCNLLNLESLILSNNDLDTTLPDQIGNLVNLKQLVLNSNQLSGKLPEGLSTMSNLKVLALDSNFISGELLSSFGNMINLEILYLADNDLHGSIPVEMGNMTGLKEFMIFANYLTGNIPTEFSKLISLFYLDVRYNKMSGMVPYAICKLREKKLESIWIDCHGGMKCACCSNCLQN